MPGKRKATRTAAASTSRRGKGSRAAKAQPVEIVVNDGLTDKQRLFIEQYFICGMNATEAALAVYDTTDRHVAQVMGSEVLSNPVIRARVDERLAQFQLTANEVLARLAFQARGSMEEFIDDSGSIDIMKAKRAKQLHLLKKFKVRHVEFSDKQGNETITTETEIELHDSQAALVHIGKHLGLFQPEVNINNFNMLTDEQLEALANGKPVRVIDAAAESVK